MGNVAKKNGRGAPFRVPNVERLKPLSSRMIDVAPSRDWKRLVSINEHSTSTIKTPRLPVEAAA
jgi:hypothetical protein